MASHKKLQSVAQSLVQSFASTLNYGPDGYVMGNLALAALKKKRDCLSFSLLKDEAEPKALLVAAVKRSIKVRREDFEDLVERNGSDAAFVTEAVMEIRFDLERAAPCKEDPKVSRLPFVCVCRIVDARGEAYVAEIRDWWLASKWG